MCFLDITQGFWKYKKYETSEMNLSSHLDTVQEFVFMQ